LVETAWELGISRNLVIIQHDLETEGLFSVDQKRRRKAVTSSRSALNGYQKGKCFYCSENISLGGGDLPHVDHFFPHCLIVTELGSRINGVWNLVLACRRCNGEKSDRVPSIKLLERLHHRNEFLIGSHHPLRETIIAQTGKSPDERAAFLQNFHLSAHAALLQTWDPQESFPGVL
jgi:5-methylcytosine-specific restriction endonuclease McrA